MQLSRAARAPQIALKEKDGCALIAVGYKGYRMVRATHGVAGGSWYYEVKICAPQGGEVCAAPTLAGGRRFFWLCARGGPLPI